MSVSSISLGRVHTSYSTWDKCQLTGHTHDVVRKGKGSQLHINAAVTVAPRLLARSFASSLICPLAHLLARSFASSLTYADCGG